MERAWRRKDRWRMEEVEEENCDHGVVCNG